MPRKSSSRRKSRRSRKSGAPKKRLQSKRKDGKVVERGAAIGTLAIGRGGLAWKVVRLPSGQKAWRLCKNPIADPALYKQHVGPTGRVVHRLTPKGRSLKKRHSGKTKCGSAQRKMKHYNKWASTRSVSTGGHRLPTKPEILRANTMRDGTVAQGANGKVYQLDRSKKTGRYSWKMCRGRLNPVTGQWEGNQPGKKLSKAQKSRAKCTLGKNVRPYVSIKGVSSNRVSIGQNVAPSGWAGLLRRSSQPQVSNQLQLAKLSNAKKDAIGQLKSMVVRNKNTIVSTKCTNELKKLANLWAKKINESKTLGMVNKNLDDAANYINNYITTAVVCKENRKPVPSAKPFQPKKSSSKPTVSGSQRFGALPPKIQPLDFGNVSGLSGFDDEEPEKTSSGGLLNMLGFGGSDTKKAARLEDDEDDFSGIEAGADESVLF